ncbi:hypothetical protein, partial [Polaromonas sp. CG_9.11]|uniref:hypothetical protein n=1 Tax=Polaromonas sp. CG_9.11 TaxID=2787730 RepID=UPI001A199BC2
MNWPPLALQGKKANTSSIYENSGKQANKREPKRKSPVNHEINRAGSGGYKSLTMTYFHTGIRTIIGAESFHCPVRDGKE